MKDSKRSLCDELIAKSGLDPEAGNIPSISDYFIIFMKDKKLLLRSKHEKKYICWLRHVLMFNGIKYHVEVNDYYTKFYLY